MKARLAWLLKALAFRIVKLAERLEPKFENPLYVKEGEEYPSFEFDHNND
jgi:hypothetical protein